MLMLLQAPMKYTSARQLPLRTRIPLFALYITAIAVALTAGIIAVINNFAPGYLLYVAFITVMIIHLARKP